MLSIRTCSRATKFPLISKYSDNITSTIAKSKEIMHMPTSILIFSHFTTYSPTQTSLFPILFTFFFILNIESSPTSTPYILNHASLTLYITYNVNIILHVLVATPIHALTPTYRGTMTSSSTPRARCFWTYYPEPYYLMPNIRQGKQNRQ